MSSINLSSSRSKATRLSHSTLELKHRCERLFQIKRLLASNKEDLRYEDESGQEHLAFGHAFGAGVQSYLVNQDAEQAIFEGWLAYWPEVESDKKNQPRLISVLRRAFTKLDNLLLEWKIEERSDIEKGYALAMGDPYYFVGYIDAVLRNRFTGRKAVLECKTTGLELTNLAPLYANSGQAVGYSILLEKDFKQGVSEFDCIYLVGQLKRNQVEDTIHVMTFAKTKKDRLNWFLSLALEEESLRRMAELNFYPQRGDACLKYNKPCSEFGTCGLSALDFPAKETEKEKAEREAKEEGLTVFSLEELINDHLA